MKKIIMMILSVCLLLANTGCTANPITPTAVSSTPSTAAETLPAETTTTAIPPVSMEAPLLAFSAPISTTQHYAKDGALLFTYTCQNISFLLEDPQIADAVMIDLLNLADYENSPASTILADAKAAYTGQDGWIPYSYSTLLSPQRFDSGILSLYGTHSLFDGSPRSTASRISVTYDLLSGRQLALKDVLIADFSADELCQRITDALSTLASSGMLYSDYAYVISEMFTTNRPVEAWYFSPDGLCFYFAPYEIAPYSAGTIVAQIPYSELTGLLKDDYFPEEMIDSTGELFLAAFQEAQLDQFNQFAELILDGNGSKYLLYTDGYLQSLQIETGAWQEDGRFLADAAVFSAPNLCSGDAVMLQVSQDIAQQLRLTYKENGITVSLNLTDLLS